MCVEALLLLVAFADPNALIRGTVVDARGGEPLARVRVKLAGTTRETSTDSKGAFYIADVDPGDYVLNVATVGYRMVNKPFSLAGGQTQEFEIVLSPEALSHSESVEVHEGVFEVARQDNATEMRLSGTEAKNLSSVLADDPLRAVQSMPGVTSNDDYNSRFSIHGAGYNHIGLFLDDVLMHAPFHTVDSNSASGSVTIFNGDMLDEMSLYSGAPPARYGDRTAGVLDIHMRDGNRDGFSFRGSAGAASAGLMGEGPIGKKGSWLVGARKSYLQYILNRTSSDPSIAFGFSDVQGRIAYSINSHNQITLSAIEGNSGLDRASFRSQLGINSLLEAGNQFTVANLGWRFTPVDTFTLSTRFAYLREKSDESNPANQALGGQHYGEWVSNTNASWAWSSNAPLDFGASIREVRDTGFENQYQFSPAAVRVLNAYTGTTTLAGGYLQQSWTARHGLVTLTAGGRYDTQTLTGATAASPYASVSLAPFAATRVLIGWGQYAQFPELQQLLSPYGSKKLLPERANHVVIALEQRLDARTRVRVEVYQRDDRDLLFRSFFDPRIVAGRIFNPPVNAPYANSVRGYARGAEIFLQRRSANRLTGWVSYSLGYTRLRDGLTGNTFPSDFDQRHTVNVYAGYRLRPTLNLSAKWLYGSGFPLPGFFQQSGSQYVLSTQRNAARLGDYQRTDVRINKAWAHDKWKITLYGEVVNLFNQSNYRFDSFNGYDSKTGKANLTLTKLFPIVPSAGVVFEH